MRLSQQLETGVVFLCVLILAPAARLIGQRAVTPSRACISAARAVLGANALVLRCGDVNGSGTQEAVAALRLKSVPTREECAPVSHVVVLRSDKAHWTTALDVAKEIKNPEGYVATDYIDDSYHFPGYCLELSDKRSDGATAFTIFLTYLNPSGAVEGSSTEISWNNKVNRYQEFADVGGFKPEIKNPPHINTRPGCCGKPKDAPATRPTKP